MTHQITGKLSAIALVVLLAVGTIGTTAGPASASTRLGGIDVNRACLHQDGPKFGDVYLKNSAYGWVCRHMEIACFWWPCGPRPIRPLVGSK